MSRTTLVATMALAGLVLGTAAMAQPANDGCTGATPVVDGNNPVDNTGATQDTLVPCTRGFAGGNAASGLDVWYSYTAPASGIRNFEILNDANSPPMSMLTLYDACGGNMLACDLGGGVSNNAKIYHYAVTAGTTYWIRFALYNNAVGAMVLDISPPRTPVALDDCEQAVAVAGQGSVAFTTVGLTNSDQNLWDCDTVRKDGWLIWTPSVSGLGVISGCGSTNAARLRLNIYDACGTVPRLCYSTFSDPGVTPICNPKIAYEVVAGQSYIVRYGVDRMSVDSTGDLVFDVRPSSLPLVVPVGAVAEPGSCTDGPATDPNGGCNFMPPATTPIQLCQTRTGIASARFMPAFEPSVAGVYQALTVDTDWYEFTLDTDQTITVTGQTEFPPSVRIMFGCPATELARGTFFSSSTVTPYNIRNGANPFTATLVAGTYYLAVGPQQNNHNPSNDCLRGSRYWFKITGSEPCSGACCGGTVCAVSTQAACTGTYQGDGVACGPVGNPTACCPANFDGANGLQVSDIFAYLNAWFASDPRSEFDGMGGLQVSDIFAFLNAWFAGC